MTKIVIIFILFIAFTYGSETCNKPCPREYDPICGVNMYNEFRIFGNQCYLENSICEQSLGMFCTVIWKLFGTDLIQYFFFSEIREKDMECCYRSNDPSKKCSFYY